MRIRHSFPLGSLDRLSGTRRLAHSNLVAEQRSRVASSRAPPAWQPTVLLCSRRRLHVRSQLSSACVCQFSARVLLLSWVNNSDPNFGRDADDNTLREVRSSANDAMFRDYKTLLYSMRSVEQFAPWIRCVCACRCHRSSSQSRP